MMPFPDPRPAPVCELARTGRSADIDVLIQLVLAHAVGVALCRASGLWPELIETIGLVIISLLVGVPAGALPFQALTKIEIPASRKMLLLGLNQGILVSLAMVVLAGAGVLGAKVTRVLTRVEIGLGLRSGLAIVAVAIFLDCVSRRALDQPWATPRISRSPANSV